MDNNLITREKRERKLFERILSSVMLFAENIFKIPVFKCQRCGECILSHTALICSQKCPKRLRNGPCGGTRENGHCEVYPERKCVWYRIYKRSVLLHRVSFLYRIEKMHNWKLEKTSAWLNVFTGRIDPPILFMKKENESSSTD
ncbi:methylenetetrahydrofolate reductase C-terminal domain-containing protein [bacterium]|nr:methylenetetrahydrofolate reductase C-terminal domain-containing protein [bacterium]